MEAELGTAGIAIDEAGVGIVIGEAGFGGGARGQRGKLAGMAGQCWPVAGSLGS